MSRFTRLTNAHLQEGFGRGTHTIEDLDLQADAEAEQLQALLSKRFNSPDYTPPVLPAAALEVYRLSQLTAVNIQQVLAALEKDPMLAARVLKIASSPLFSPQPVPSLHAAIVRLGLRNLTGIVWEVAANLKVFRSKAYEQPMESARVHSMATAYLSRLVAKLTSVPLDYAFLCGLLHDVGVAASLLLLSENTKSSLKEEVLALALRNTHAEAACVVARLWNLPSDIQIVLGNHHLVSIQGHVHPAAAVVAVAEQLASEGGFDLRIGDATWVDATDQKVQGQARAALGLTEQTMAMLRREAEVLLADLKELTKQED